MTFTIPDDILAQAGLTNRDAMVEFACLLFDTERLDKPTAARLAGLDRPQFEAELLRRGIAPWRPTLDEFEEDVRALEKLRKNAS